MQTWKELNPEEIAKKIFELLGVECTERKYSSMTKLWAILRERYGLEILTYPESSDLEITVFWVATGFRIHHVLLKSCTDISFETEDLSDPGKAGQANTEVTIKHITLESRGGKVFLSMIWHDLSEGDRVEMSTEIC